MTRFERLRGTPQSDLPELDWGQHLVDALLEFGPALEGPVPVTFQELEAWARTTRTDLPGYEALLLRQLSREYCQEYHAASDPHRPAPYAPAGSDEALASGFTGLLKRFEQ